MDELLLVNLNDANELLDGLLGVAGHLLYNDGRECVEAFVGLGVLVLILNIAVIDLV